MHWILIVMVALAACGKSKAECRTEAESFGKLLAAADLSQSVLQVDDTMDLVERTDLRPYELHEAPVVYLDAKQTRYQGKLIANVGELGELLAAAHASIVEMIESGKVPRRNPPDPRRLIFAIDAATPWSSVVATVDVAAKAGMTAPEFVFDLPVTWKAPPRAPIDTELDKIVDDKEGGMATRFAEITKRLVQRCPSVVRIFGEVSAVEGGNKTEYIARALPKALIDCDCNVDMPDFRATIWRIMANPRPMRVLAFDPDAPAKSIAAPGAKPWREVAPTLAPDVGNAKLVVE